MNLIKITKILEKGVWVKYIDKDFVDISHYTEVYVCKNGIVVNEEGYYEKYSFADEGKTWSLNKGDLE